MPGGKRTMTEDYDLNEFTGSKFFKGKDFVDNPEYFTITDVHIAEFKDGRRKPVLSFEDTEKTTPLGPMNVDRLKDKFGDKTSGWVGRTVMLMAGPEFNGNPSLVVLPQKPPKAANGTASTQGDGAPKGSPPPSDTDIPF
jgi:hypothetical protein